MGVRETLQQLDHVKLSPNAHSIPGIQDGNGDEIKQTGAY